MQDPMLEDDVASRMNFRLRDIGTFIYDAIINFYLVIDNFDDHPDLRKDRINFCLDFFRAFARAENKSPEFLWHHPVDSKEYSETADIIEVLSRLGRDEPVSNEDLDKARKSIVIIKNNTIKV